MFSISQYPVSSMLIKMRVQYTRMQILNLVKNSFDPETDLGHFLLNSMSRMEHGTEMFKLEATMLFLVFFFSC